MELVFVLVEPAVAENVGAAARAINTMGFTQLRIVNSDAYLQHKARILAHGSGQILDDIEHYDSLSEALADVDFTVATSAKPRHHRHLPLTPEQTREVLASKGEAVCRCALVFGREESGLNNSELGLCDLVTSVPLAKPYPSLNLSQAVMLYAYSLSSLSASGAMAVESADDYKDENQYSTLKLRVSDLLCKLNYDKQTKLHRWALERLARASQRDIHFLHSISHALESRWSDDR